MAIQQVAFDVPNDIVIGLAKGIYKQFGGVIRDAKTGALVKHLDPVEAPAKKAGSAALQAVKEHPVAAIGIGAAVAVGTGVTVYVAKKRAEKKHRKNSPECVVKFEKSLKKYLKAVREGNLHEKDIDALLSSLEEMRELEDESQINLDLSTRELKQLVDLIYNYTRKLAKANNVKLDRFKQNSPSSIINLEEYLKVQKQIFKEVS